VENPALDTDFPEGFKTLQTTSDSRMWYGVAKESSKIGNMMSACMSVSEWMNNFFCA
jgi:hypothetical protein